MPMGTEGDQSKKKKKEYPLLKSTLNPNSDPDTYPASTLNFNSSPNPTLTLTHSCLLNAYFNLNPSLGSLIKTQSHNKKKT